MAKKKREIDPEDLEAQKEFNKLKREHAKIVKDIRELNKIYAKELETGLGDQKEANRFDAERVELVKKLSAIQLELNMYNEEYASISEMVTDTISEEASFQRDIVSSMNGILHQAKDRFKIEDRMAASFKLQNSLVSEIVKISRDDLATKGQVVTFAQNALTIHKEIAQQEIEAAKATEDIAHAQIDTSNILDSIKAIKHEMNIIDEHRGELTDREYAKLADSYKIGLHQLETLKSQLESIEEAKNVGEEMGQKFESAFDKMGDVIHEMPGGDFIMKHLGFDKMKEQLSEKFTENMTSSFLEVGKSGGSMFKGLIGGVKGFGTALISGPQVAIFGIIAVVALLVSMFMELDGEVAQIGKDLAISHEEAGKVHEQAVGLANEMNLVSINSEAIVDTIKEMNEELPGVTQAFIAGNEHAIDMVKTASILKEQFGLSADQIGKLNTLSAITGKSVGDLTAEAGAMGEKTIGTKAAMEALADVSPEVAVAFKGSTKELTKAAIQAKALGTTLSDIQNIGDAMLDIESSLSKEMEARMLTGKNINLDRARELALNGDISGLQNELLNQMGSLSEFQGMNRLAQQSFAESMGMSVEQMTEMLGKAEELKHIGMSQDQLNKLMENSYEEQLKKVEELRAAGNEEGAAALERLAHEKESASVQERFGAAMGKLKDTVMKMVAPLVEWVNTLMSGEETTEGISGALGGVGSIMKVLGKILVSVVKPAFEFLIAPVKYLMGLIDGVIKMFTGDFKGGLETLGKSIMDFLLALPKKIITTITGLVDSIFGTNLTEGVEGFFNKISDAFGQIYAMAAPVFEFIWDIIKELGIIIWDSIVPVFQEVWGVISGVFDEIGSALGGLFGSGGEAESGVSSFGDTMKSIFGAIKPVIQVIGKVIAFALVGPMKLAIDAVKMINDLLGGNLMGIIKDFGSLLFDLVISPFEFLWDIVQSIITMFTDGFVAGLEQLGKSIIDNLMSPFEKVVGIAKKIPFIGGLFGGGDDEESEKQVVASEQTGKFVGTKTEDATATSQAGTAVEVDGAAEGGTVKSSGIAVVGEQGPELVALPRTATVANASVSEQVGAIASQMSQQPQGQMSTEKIDKMIALLEQLVSQTEGPVVFNVDGRVIKGIGRSQSLSKRATLGLDNTYGVTG